MTPDLDQLLELFSTPKEVAIEYNVFQDYLRQSPRTGSTPKMTRTPSTQAFSNIITPKSGLRRTSTILMKRERDQDEFDVLQCLASPVTRSQAKLYNLELTEYGYPLSQNTAVGKRRKTDLEEAAHEGNERSVSQTMPVQASSQKPKRQTAKSVFPVVASNAKKSESSWKVWTKTEEVFLVGSVFELLFERGSLTASNERSDVWQTVKKKYDNAWRLYTRYQQSAGQSGSDPYDRSCSSVRSSKALYRHYKVLKERVAGNSTNAPPPGTNGEFCFRKYYYAYQTILAKVSVDSATSEFDNILDGIL